jgi:hypothetical protein
MNLPSFIAGYLIGAITLGIWYLYRLQRRPKMPTMRRAKEQSARIPCRACYGSDLPCVCKHYPKTREPEPPVSNIGVWIEWYLRNHEGTGRGDALEIRYKKAMNLDARKPSHEQIPEQIRVSGQIREADLADVGGIGDGPIYMYGVTGEER